MAPSPPAAGRRPRDGSGATCPCSRPHNRRPSAPGRGSECRAQLWLASGLRAELEQAAAELAKRPLSRRVRGPENVDERPATAAAFRGSGRRSARVWVSVTPCCAGYCPVRSVARLGEHIDVLQNARPKLRPVCARRRSLGMRSSSQPGSSGQWHGWRCWSVITNRMFGCGALTSGRGSPWPGSRACSSSSPWAGTCPSPAGPCWAWRCPMRSGESRGPGRRSG